MSRRKETTETKVVRSKRIEFTVEDLRHRLRLPDDAVLTVYDPEGLVKTEAPLENLGLVATFTRTVTK